MAKKYLLFSTYVIRKQHNSCNKIIFLSFVRCASITMSGDLFGYHSILILDPPFNNYVRMTLKRMIAIL